MRLTQNGFELVLALSLFCQGCSPARAAGCVRSGCATSLVCVADRCAAPNSLPVSTTDRRFFLTATAVVDGSDRTASIGSSSELHLFAHFGDVTLLPQSFTRAYVVFPRETAMGTIRYKASPIETPWEVEGVSKRNGPSEAPLRIEGDTAIGADGVLRIDVTDFCLKVGFPRNGMALHLTGLPGRPSPQFHKGNAAGMWLEVYAP